MKIRDKLKEYAYNLLSRLFSNKLINNLIISNWFHKNFGTLKIFAKIEKYALFLKDKEMDDLVPPIEKIFDGANSREKFIDNGDNFVKYFLINHARLEKDERVLDIGCGIGQKARALAHYLGPNGIYEGFDIVPLGIEWCTEKYRRYANFHFQLANIYNSHYNPESSIKSSEYQFPYPDNEFDIVFLCSIFTHMLPGDLQHYFSEIARVMKKHARCVITYFLINKSSSAKINANLNKIHFPFEYSDKFGHCFIANNEKPETTVAYNEEYIKDIYNKHGLSIIEITYGHWCGRKDLANILQDTIIAVKE